MTKTMPGLFIILPPNVKTQSSNPFPSPNPEIFLYVT